MAQQPILIKGKIKLSDFAPDFRENLEKDATKAVTAKLAHEIGELQQRLYANSGPALLLVFQGMDASGKDGAARTVLKEVNPAGVQVTSFKVPSEEERAHDYLWRIHRAIPRSGYIGVFNRSHYEAVLAERVLEIAPKSAWSKRFAQIVDWERMLVENDVVVLKFFLHISRKEQAERLRERIENPEKRWKFAVSDLETRARWKDYMEAYEDVLNKTSHEHARWHLVPADRNWYRDYIVANAVVEALRKLKLGWPEPKIDLSKIKID